MHTQNEPALKPCPFCGAEAEYISQSWNKYPFKPEPVIVEYWAVICPTKNCRCEATLSRDDDFNFLYPTKEQAASAWNKRATI